MDLKSYLNLLDIEYQDFAELIKAHPTTISNYIHGRRKPSSTMSARIEKITKGKVTLHDLEAYWETHKK